MFTDDLVFKVDGRDLTDKELKKVTIFILELSRVWRRIIYRGENEENLRRKLNINSTENIFERLSYFIFMVGDKARAYHLQNRDSIINEGNIYPIDSLDQDVFYMIFDKFYNVFHTSTNRENIDFREYNHDFATFFQNRENRNIFLNKILEIQNDHDKLIVRDYYLSLLHKIGKVGLHYTSLFVSTTLDKEVSDHFAKVNVNSEKSITFVGWFARKASGNGLIKRYSLPVYNRGIYLNQREISMKGGILPHYLLGYIVHSTNEFFINPNFFTTNKEISSIVKDGLDIDQTNFIEVLRQTNYTGYITLDGDENWRDYRL